MRIHGVRGIILVQHHLGPTVAAHCVQVHLHEGRLRGTARLPAGLKGNVRLEDVSLSQYLLGNVEAEDIWIGVVLPDGLELLNIWPLLERRRDALELQQCEVSRLLVLVEDPRPRVLRRRLQPILVSLLADLQEGHEAREVVALGGLALHVEAFAHCRLIQHLRQGVAARGPVDGEPGGGALEALCVHTAGAVGASNAVEVSHRLAGVARVVLLLLDVQRANDPLEDVAIQTKQLGRRRRGDCGRAWGSIDEGQLTESFALPVRANHVLVETFSADFCYFDAGLTLAARDHEKLSTNIALFHDNVPPFVGALLHDIGDAGNQFVVEGFEHRHPCAQVLLSHASLMHGRAGHGVIIHVSLQLPNYGMLHRPHGHAPAKAEEHRVLAKERPFFDVNL
mmetsp:Transcript_3144/g.7478  ORF Transcript_3144/g.7478 Transcript_3144/m.7478 type:complete len:395 (-) Transcript_3144:421-1605(-)